MSKPFKFKEFTINQDQCAMKIGTDGVLLGAWTSIIVLISCFPEPGPLPPASYGGKGFPVLDSTGLPDFDTFRPTKETQKNSTKKSGGVSQEPR